MSLQNVKRALEMAYYTPTQLLATYPVAFENINFEPTAGTPYVQFTFSPGQPKAHTAGRVGIGRDLVGGLYYIDLFYPSNTGLAQAVADYELIRARYYSGKDLTYSDQAVRIMSCGMSAGIIVDNSWFKVRTTVRFEAQTLR